MTGPTPVALRRIVGFWLPLWATWLMMAVEGPFLAAVIARLPDPTFNLAAYGVAYSFALIVESPVIMLLSASTALVRDGRALRRLRTFTYLLCGGITLAMFGLLVPAVFRLVVGGLLGLDDALAGRIHVAVALLLPWPGAIGYRRFYQGVLIRHDLTRRVAYGTVVRLAAMGGTALALAGRDGIAGAWVGASALAAGVSAEAVASRIMAAGVVRRLRAGGDGEGSAALSLPAIARFYTPLALTSMLTLAVQPLVTFFVAHGRAALESLAVLPVIMSLVFVFRTPGLAFQEVGIALVGDRHENHRQLRRFAFALALGATVGLAALAWTPLCGWWYGTVSGLAAGLADFAALPTRILTLMPALTVVLSFQCATLVSHRRTRPISFSTLVEVGGIAATLVVAITALDAVGAVAAAAGLMVGRVGANLALLRPLRRLPAPPDA